MILTEEEVILVQAGESENKFALLNNENLA
jgi:hypothetical protein